MTSHVDLKKATSTLRYQDKSLNSKSSRNASATSSISHPPSSFSKSRAATLGQLDDGVVPENGGYLWGSLKRYEYGKFKSLPGHDKIVRTAIPTIRATLVTGHKACGCGPWADTAEKSHFNTLLGTVWKDLAKRLREKEDEPDVDVQDRPCEEEAKKVELYFVFRIRSFHY